MKTALLVATAILCGCAKEIHEARAPQTPPVAGVAARGFADRHVLVRLATSGNGPEREIPPAVW